MSRKRRHGPPVTRTQQPRQYDAPRHVLPQGGVGLADRGGHDNGGNGNGGGPATIVMRDADGHPYVVLADSAGRGGYGASTAYAQGARQAQTATAQAAQAMQATAPNGGTGFAAKPYPDMPKVSDAKPLLRSLGATGTAIFSGIITSEEYNEDFYWKDAIQVYEQMIRNDAQIFAVVQLLELPIRRAVWSIEPGGDEPRDEEIASFVETCLFHEMRYTTSEGRTLTQKWDDILRHILMMLRFGFMAFETNWCIEDGWTKWARWTPLLPRTVWRWWVGDDNELVGIQQWTFKNYSYQFVDIPADKLLLFVHRQEGNNYEGVSVLRSAYKHWYYKDNFYKIEAIDIERNAAEIPAIYLPEQFTDADLANAQSILQNMRVNENMGVTLPPGWKIEYIRTYGRQTAGVQPSIEHHDAMIARNVLGQFINLGSHEVGSYALAETQRAMLLAALQAECEYIEDVINNDAIPRLVDYNFEDVENYPRIKASKLIAQDLDVISTALNKLTSAPSGPLIHGDPDLEDYLRDLYGLPKAPAGVVQGTNPTAPSTPERPETDTAEEAAGDDHADAESKDATPTEQQQAVSQAVANQAPNVRNAGGPQGGAAPVQAADGGAGGMGEEARLLREALTAAYDHDAVERGLQFFNPAHVPAGSPSGGEFAPKGGGEAGGSVGAGRARSGGAKRSAAPKAGGTGRARGGAGAGTEKEPKAPAAAKPKAAGKAKGAGAVSEAERIQHVPMAQVHVGLNPREHFDQEHLDELAASIKAHGLLQPITVREHEGGYQIIAGERRFRAMQALGYSHAPAIVKNVDERTARELALIENVARADMRPSETARAYKALMDSGHSVKDISERIGKSQASIQQHLALLELSPHLQKAVDEERLPMGAVRELSRLSPAHQDEAADQIIREGMGLRSAKSLLQAYNAKEAQISMFPTAHGPSKEAIAAHVRYRTAMDRVTKELSHLDDKTMKQLAGVVDSPFREATRLDLMAKQLRRMQKALEVEGHARNIGMGGAAVTASERQRETPGRRLYAVVTEALAAAKVAMAEFASEGGESIRLFNPMHYPAGGPQGGEFAPKGGGGIGGGSGSMRGRASGGRGSARGGAAHHGGSGGSARGSGSASKTKGEGEPKAKAPRAKKAGADDETKALRSEAKALKAAHGVPREDIATLHNNWLRHQDDPTDPAEALARSHGDYQALFQHLSHEPTGVTEAMAAHRNMPADAAKLPRGSDRLEIARHIATQMAPAAERPALEKSLLREEIRMRQAAQAEREAAKGEGAARSRGTRGKAAKSEEERAAEKLTAARQRVADAEANVRAANQINNVHGQATAHENLGKAQEALARLEGRKLGPGEKGIPREDYLAGKGIAPTRGNTVGHVSAEEARAYLANPTPRGAGKATAATGEGKSAREAELERQVAALRQENEALRAGGAGGRGTAGAKGEESGTKASGRGKAGEYEHLKPTGPVDLSRLTPTGAQDPYAIHQGFGRAQTERVLRDMTLENLRRSADIVMGRNPGTKPASRSRKSDVVDYIMQHLPAEPA